MAKMISVFVNNYHLSAAGIQFLVGLTTLLMVLRFALDYLRHRSIGWVMRNLLLMLDTATYALLHYSLGVMQRPSLKNSYYQVWAVLLVTLRYSVKHGRPAGVALRQTPLVDLMSSFWAANILRSRAPALLKVPVWLLWSVNSARIIHGFVSSEHATASHKENVRLVTEYMRPPSAPAPATNAASEMAGCKYLVLGEAKQRKKVRHPNYRLELELTKEEKLITVEKIWAWSSGDDQMVGSHGRRVSELLNQEVKGKSKLTLKDLCLSFALYKLLRRRFFNLPIHESNLEETKQLVFQGILNPPVPQSGEGVAPPARVQVVNLSGERGADEGERQSTEQDSIPNYKRALKISKVELSFLNDFFFSRHALMFATGFPFMRLLFSTLLVGAISYMAVAIHRFSKTATEDELGRVRVHHGVFFTWILLTLLGVKEIFEIAGYVLSDWTKVLLVCKYVRQPWWLRGPVMAVLVRRLCRHSFVTRWDGKIGQFNLLFCRRRRYRLELTGFDEDLQKAIFVGLRNRSDDKKPPSDRPYVDRALLLLSRGKSETKDAFEKAIHAALKEYKEDVHRILLWHIATCYCECQLANERQIGVKRPWCVRIPLLPTRKSTGVWVGPFIELPKLDQTLHGYRRTETSKKHYITAVRLSQYCAHLVRMTPALIPGNDIIITAVLDEVLRETNEALFGCFSVGMTFRKLEAMVEPQNIDRSTTTRSEANQRDEQESTGEEANDPGDQRTLLKVGSELGQKLIDATSGQHEARWAFLEELWAGYVLHLAESTRASKHKIYLSRGGDLMTHLWALLSHAGFMGSVEHGEMGAGVQNDEVQREGVYADGTH